jgi:hypothetical protein
MVGAYSLLGRLDEIENRVGPMRRMVPYIASTAGKIYRDVKLNGKNWKESAIPEGLKQIVAHKAIQSGSGIRRRRINKKKKKRVTKRNGVYSRRVMRMRKK